MLIMVLLVYVYYGIISICLLWYMLIMVLLVYAYGDCVNTLIGLCAIHIQIFKGCNFHGFHG